MGYKERVIGKVREIHWLIKEWFDYKERERWITKSEWLITQIIVINVIHTIPNALCIIANDILLCDIGITLLPHTTPNTLLS